MTITLWGDRAKQEDSKFDNSPLIAFKSVAVKEWNGARSGSLLQNGSLAFDSNLPDAKRIQQWWSQSGSSQDLLQLSQQVAGGGGAAARNATPTTLVGIRLASEQLTSQPQIFSASTRLSLVQTRKQGEQQPLHYMACQEPQEGRGLPCNRRVDENGFCAACNRAGKIAPRLNLRCKFVDAEDQAWLTCFHEAASKVLGLSAEEVRALELAAGEKGEAGREELDAKIQKAYFNKRLNITVRAKMDNYNGESRTNVTVVDARPVSYGEHGRAMLKDINELLAKEASAGA